MKKEDIIQAIKIAGKRFPDIHIRHSHAINMADTMEFRKEYKIDDKIPVVIRAEIPLEEKTSSTAYGEEITESRLSVHINVFFTGISDNRHHQYHTIAEFEKCIDQFVRLMPVRYKSKEYGNGIGFEWNDTQLLIPRAKIDEISQTLEIVPKTHFNKIEIIEIE